MIEEIANRRSIRSYKQDKVSKEMVIQIVQAGQYIAIDLDDRVKHNYALFQDVLAKIK